MRRLTRIGVALGLLGGIVCGEEELPPLPTWSPSDFAKLERGEYIPGEDFFGPAEGETSGPLAAEQLPDPAPEEPVLDESASEIAAEFIEAYFEEAPVDEEGQPRYLIDPQELLAQQDFRDRESFLKYHAGESAIEMYVYLFDARQELPEGVTLASVYEKHFAGGDPCAVIFYHLGTPDRAELILSREVRAVVSEDEQRRGLRAAVQEAFEKSDSAYQLDNFLVELSIRLYWIEREMAGVAPRLSSAEVQSVALAGLRMTAGAHQRDQTRNLISRLIILGGVLIGLVLLGWLAKCVAERRIRYVFPEVETGPLLGAPHAAGVGAVLSFSSNQIPPSQQRDQVPDYLQRM